MKVEVNADEVIIRIPRINPPRESKSAKSWTIATTQGIIQTDVVVDGKPLNVGVNCYISKN